MIRNKTIVEVELQGRTYRLECSPESPLEEVSQAIVMINQIVEQMKPQPEIKPEETSGEE